MIREDRIRVRGSWLSRWRVAAMLLLMTGCDGENTISPLNQRPRAEPFKTHPWGRWPARSFVKLHCVEVQRGQTTTCVETHTLREKGPTEYVVSIARDNMEPVDTTRSYEVGGIHHHPEAECLGSQGLSAEGSSFDCTVWRFYKDEGGRRVEIMSWVKDGVSWPLQTRVRNLSTGNVEREARVLSTRQETVVIGSDNVVCTRLELMEARGPRATRQVLWLTDSIPGGIARYRQMLAANDPDQWSEQINVVEYGVGR